MGDKKVHISKYSGKRAVVDASTWLYRGCYSCAREVALQIKTEKFLRFVMHRVNLLRYNKIHVTMVFDGNVLPLKDGTCKQRRSSKRDALAKARKFENEARQCQFPQEKRKLWGQADKYYKQAYSPKFSETSLLIRELKKANVPYIVAPYEADAQLVYMYVACDFVWAGCFP